MLDLNPTKLKELAGREKPVKPKTKAVELDNDGNVVIKFKMDMDNPVGLTGSGNVRLYKRTIPTEVAGLSVMVDVILNPDKMNGDSSDTIQ